MDKNVSKAVGRVDRYLAGWRICQPPWQTIRARLVELEAENERLQAQLDAGTEAGWHALRNERDALQADLRDADERCALRSRERTEAVMRAEKAESRLAAADALLRDMRGGAFNIGGWSDAIDEYFDAHLSESTHDRA